MIQGAPTLSTGRVVGSSYLTDQHTH